MKIFKKYKIEDYYLEHSNKENSEWRMYLKNEYGIRNQNRHDKNTY
jgi:hypothetical protein